jgi:tRNA pseudouridine55 synthase
MIGCGAHLGALRRTQVGDLDLTQAVTLAELEAGDEAARFANLLPVDALLRELPVIDLDGDAAVRFRHGNPVTCTPGTSGKRRVYVDGRLVGIGEYVEDGRLWPKRLVQLAD